MDIQVTSQMPQCSAEATPVNGAKGPIKVLHIAYRLQHGGIETWLMHVLRRACKEEFEFHIVVDELGHAHDEEARQLGAHVHLCSRVIHPIRFARQVADLNTAHGPFHLLHSHVVYSAIVLILTRYLPLAGRIVHSHASGQIFKDTDMFRRLLLRATHPLVRWYASHGLACSESAAEAMFGKNWKQDPRWQVLHYGIDLEPFERARQQPYPYRKELNIPESAFVIGNVARLVYQKNFPLFVRISREYLRIRPDAYFVIIGDGPLRSDIERMVASLGLSERFRFLGARNDVPQLMTHLLDLLLMPSHYEGLPVTVIEAQAAGLPAVVSQAVPDEAFITKEGMQRVNTAEVLHAWVRAIEQLRSVDRPSYRESIWPHLCASDFNINVSASRLFDLYRLSKARSSQEF